MVKNRSMQVNISLFVQMAQRAGNRVETYRDSMALLHILQNNTKGHKMPFLVNFMHPGQAITQRYHEHFMLHNIDYKFIH